MHYDELYHHGILGMKWGVKNGPPYPLSGSSHSASEKKAGWRKSLTGSKEEKRRKKQSKADKARAKKKIREKQLEEKRELDKQKRREKILKNPTLLNKHREEFTQSEIEAALRKFDMDRRLRDASIDRLNTAKKYVDMALGYYQTASKIYGTYTSIHKNIEANTKIDKSLKELNKKEKKSK